MTDAKRDNNQNPVMIGLLNSDGTTPTRVKVDPTSHALQCSEGATGSDLSDDTAARDNNQVTTLLGVSADDGVTPTPIYVDSSGNLLTKAS